MTDSTGTIVATCLSAEGGVPKYPQDQVVITSAGIEGDYHSTPGANPRAVSVVGREVYDDLEGSLNFTLKPGDFSENILTEGLGDLSELGPGDRMRFGNGVEIEVTAAPGTKAGEHTVSLSGSAKVDRFEESSDGGNLKVVIVEEKRVEGEDG